MRETGGEEEELALVRRIRAGDTEAFEGLVARHARPVRRIAWRITGDESAAEDVVQETFLRVFRFLDRFDDRADFSTWLHRIAVNAAIDHLRRARRQPTVPARWQDDDAPDGLEPVSCEPAPDRRLNAGEIGRAARRALADLSPAERAAFVLRHFEGRSIAEIGVALGKGDNATKQSIFRAVRKLRHALAGFTELPHEELA